MNKQIKSIQHIKTPQIFIISIIILIETIIMIGCTNNTTQTNIPDCVVSNTLNSEYNLTIIANKDKIENKEAFAKQLIEQVRNNDFKTILFSYDENGYPTKLEMAVYLNEKDWEENNSIMHVSLTQQNILNKYNIVEHLDKFQLTIQ